MGLIYNECEEIQGLQYTCDPCNATEAGRVRSLCLIKPGTILPTPLTLQAIEILIAQDKLFVLPETSGTFDGGTPKMGTGYGDNKERLLGYDYSLIVKEPNYIGNRDFMQAVENREEWHLAYRTETKLAVVYDSCTVTVKNPIEEGLDTDVAWTLDCKWFSKTKPVLVDYPVNLFAGIFKTYEYITGLSIPTGGAMYLEVDSDKTCYIVCPDGSLLTSTAGVIDTTWTGVAGEIISIVPKNSVIKSIPSFIIINGRVQVDGFDYQTSGTFTKIAVQRNAEDFNSVREVVTNITDASPTNRYVVYVEDGEWEECDLHGKANVIIQGQSKENTIINCDGTSTKLTPDDYVFAEYANTALNAVPTNYKHTIWGVADLQISNATITGKSIKYPIHADAPGAYDMNVYNCIITVFDGSTSTLAGFGVWANQNVLFNYCTFKRSANYQYAIFVHTWNDQTAGTTFRVENCVFDKTNYMFMQDLGSNHLDLVTLKNNTCNYENKLYWGVDPNYWLDANGNPITEQAALPYFMRLNYSNTILNIIPSNPWSPEIIARPDYLNYTNIS